MNLPLYCFRTTNQHTKMLRKEDKKRIMIKAPQSKVLSPSPSPSPLTTYKSLLSQIPSVAIIKRNSFAHTTRRERRCSRPAKEVRIELQANAFHAYVGTNRDSPGPHVRTNISDEAVICSVLCTCPARDAQSGSIRSPSAYPLP